MLFNEVYCSARSSPMCMTVLSGDKSSTVRPVQLARKQASILINITKWRQV